MPQSQVSLSRRFIITLMSVVIVLVGIFAALAISVNITRVETQLTQRLEDAAILAARGLVAPIWNVDEETIIDILKALLSSEAMVHVRLTTEDGDVYQQVVPEFQDKELSFFEQSPRLFVSHRDIFRQQEKLGRLQLAISRERVQREVRLNVIAIVALTALLLTAIILASIVVTRRYIARPLVQLEQAAALIADGDLEVPIDMARQDEIGRLAQAFDTMRVSMQQLIGALRDNNAQLQHLDQLKDEFLANTSHELRTPLNGIIGLAESLIDGATGPLSNATNRNLGMIVASGKRLASLVNDILDFSKLRHEDFELELKPLDISALTDVVLTLSQPLVGQKPLALINQIDSNLPLVAADENRVQQIMYNLVGNAIKFTESGEVTVAAQVQGDQLAITVTDTGIGIPKGAQERIFESFEQADGTTARAYGGTGLGLAVTKKLVELHGGRIEVVSEVGVGSQFTFTLPLSDEAAVSASQEEPPAQMAAKVRTYPQLSSSEGVTAVAGSVGIEAGAERDQAPAASRYKVLIVDDEPVNLQVLENHLSIQNYEVTQAQNGLEAMAFINAGERFDLVILDVMMPRMSGYEVCQQLREKFAPNELPVMLLSAKDQVTDLVTGLQTGANDYLTKPISKEELLARVETHLNLKELIVENVRLSAELEVTQRLQKMILPTAAELSQVEGLEIAGYMEPAEEVGGDYYDVLQRDGQVKIAIGDVTGHGLESGMVMLMTQMAVRTLLANGETDPVRFLDALNRALYGNVQRMGTDKNLTLSLIDYAGGAMKLSGQHEDMIVVRQSGALELVDTADLGFPIGLDDEIADFIGQTTVSLHPGDGVVLYTDGITEAENLNGGQYGQERLCEVVREHWSKSAEAIKDAVVADVKRHIGEQEVYDDITLVVVKQQ